MLYNVSQRNGKYERGIELRRYCKKYNNHLTGIPGRQQWPERVKAILKGIMAENFQEMTNHRFKKPNNPNKDK